MEKYYAITRSADTDDELKHFKYIKRVKMPSGKWKYIYDADQKLTKYKNGFSTTQTSNDGKTELDKITEYKQTDDLFDGTSRWSFETGPYFKGDQRHREEHTTHKQGKISRAIAKGEKWIFDNLISSSKKTAPQKNKKKNVADKMNEGIAKIKAKRK